MSISPNDVSITLSHHIDQDGEYDAFYSIKAHIHINNNEAGYISCTIVDRSRIPRGMFLSAMDGHSGELQEISVMFFEAKLGRTRVRLLREGGDGDPIMYIEKVHVEERYRMNGNSDVGTFALNKLLHHAYLTSWNCCMCIYILDASELMDPELRRQVEDGDDETMDPSERKRLIKRYQRLDANQFLRNGFYQDATIASIAPHCIVAARSHWEKPLKSHDAVARIQFHEPPPFPESPTGKDKEILELTKTACSEPSNLEAVAEYTRSVQQLIQEGGNLARSNALHAACALDNSHIVSCILSMDPSTLESRDVHDVTPLMMAAETISGKGNIHGFPANQPVIDLLLASGADKDATNRDGLTAYGIFVKSVREYTEAIYSMMGRQIPSDDTKPGYNELREKLMPVGGPTMADMTGGDSEDDGIIHYDEDEDNFSDEEGDY